MTTRPETFMRLAIAQARLGIARGQSPFGALIVSPLGVVIAAAHNRVWAATDPTAHAEVNAIRAAARRLRRIDLAGHTLYSTCEPCPMCMAAIHWAKLDRVVYGAAIADAAGAGFHELRVPAEKLLRQGGSCVKLQPGCLAASCRRLFAEWKRAGGTAY
ncbi:MAG TPA: nucleoside deaminase [Terriglobales bacterium]|nr:nucleoside deaminase [Terriglobales bacterium]